MSDDPWEQIRRDVEREEDAQRKKSIRWSAQIQDAPTFNREVIKTCALGLKKLSQDPIPNLQVMEDSCMQVLCDAIAAGAFGSTDWQLWRACLAQRPNIQTAAFLATKYNNAKMHLAPGSSGIAYAASCFADLIDSFLGEENSTISSPAIAKVPAGKWRARPFDPTCTIFVDPDQGLIDAMRVVVGDWNDNWDTVEALLRPIGYSLEEFPALTIGVIRQAIALHRKPLMIKLAGTAYTNTPQFDRLTTEAGTDRPQMRQAAGPIPLTVLQQRTLDIIKDQSPGSTISGRQIVEILQSKYDAVTSENTLTSHIIPALKPLGVQSARKRGYWFVKPIE